MRELVQRIEQNIVERGLLRQGQSVLIAVSGGVDSMTLLEVLRQLAPRHGWRLIVAHFNHQLRGAGSDADEELARHTADQLGLPWVAGRADVRSFARRHKLSIEMAARRLRHEFLARSAREHRQSAIALAHHADDQVELFFLRLLRGSGPDALAGMKWISSSPADASIQLVRPLLNCSKLELCQYASERQIAFREDASNASFDFQRNRVRHELIPLLIKDYQPALKANVLRLMDLQGAEAEFVGEAAGDWLQASPRQPFACLPVALQRRCLQQQLFQLGVTPDYDLIEQLRLSNQPVTINPALTVCRDEAGWLRRVETAAAVFASSERTVALGERRGAVIFDRVAIRWSFRKRTAANLRAPTEAGVEYFDAGKVGSTIHLRHWRPGDRLRPIGMSGTAKLQDLFVNLKVPRERRHQLVVGTTADGRLFWVEGLRLAEPFKLDQHTTRILRWQWSRQRVDS